MTYRVIISMVVKPLSKKYFDGDIIGPYNIKMIKRTRREGNKYYGLFICPLCEKKFKSQIKGVAAGTTRSCGCYNLSIRRDVGKKNAKDITGQRFGRLVALEPLEERKRKRIVWKCQCDCGKIVNVVSSDLLNGKTKSCGCYNLELRQKAGKKRGKNIIGQRFGRLVVIQRAEKKQSNGAIIWLCKCDCGNFVEISGTSLRRGTTQSCGCLKSLGENKIKNILDENGISYIQEANFSTCVNPETGQRFRFDFFLYEYNVFIECNGEQHYKPVERFGGQEKFEKIKKADRIKRQWAKDNNYDVLDIKYKHLSDIKVSEILDFIQSHKKR